MNILGISTIIDGVGKIADDLVTSKEEKLQIALQERQLDTQLLLGQIEVNKEEARHGSIFVAGWRPFIGWVGGAALAYQFVFYPLLIWIWALLQAGGVIPCHLDQTIAMEMIKTLGSNAANECTFTPPPPLPGDALFAIVTGMLGIGGMRSFDKLKNTDTKAVGK